MLQSEEAPHNALSNANFEQPSACVARVILRILYIILLCGLLNAAVSSAFAAQVILQWDPNPEPTVAGYRVYYGLSGRNYIVGIDAGKVTAATVFLLKDGATHYIAATAYDHQGSESDFSEELCHPEEPPSEPASGGGGDPKTVIILGEDVPDSDGDGIDDGTEALYWGDDAQSDADLDGLANIDDPDSDNDGYSDGDEISANTDPADPDSYPAIVYEDGEDGTTIGWHIHPEGSPEAMIRNVYADARQSRVIETAGDGTRNAYELR